MMNPGTLLDNIVTKLRLVSALVTEMGGDATHIAAYYDSYPRSVSVLRAISDLVAPALLVVYDGTYQASGRMQSWAHAFRLILKLREPPLTVTKAAATLTSISVAANVGTVTWPAHGLEAGCSVTISGATVDTDLNGTYAIVTAPTADTFTIATAAVADATYTEATLAAHANTSGAKHYAALHLLVDGIPTGGALKLLNMEINSGCDGMDVPRFERQSLIIDQLGNQMDYWVVRWVLTEKGDS
jgi:hypothetical protein